MNVFFAAPASAPVLGSPQLLLFLLHLAGLLLLAVLFGQAARRLGLPSVVGELLVGVVLGPSVVGHLPAGVSEWLPQRQPGQLALLEVTGQLGVLLLVALAAMELDLTMLRRRSKVALTVGVSGLVLPLGLGVASGLLLPQSLRGGSGGPVTFALFLGVAMCVSAIPVIAKILIDMRLQHRNIGQLILIACVMSDVAGWLLLSLVAAMATTGSALERVGVSVLTLLAVIGAAATVGRWTVPPLLRRAAATEGALPPTIVILVLLSAAVTHALHLEAVLGAFLCGLLISSAGLPHARLAALRTFVIGVLAPVFFAMAGLRMDLTLLARPPVLVAGLAMLVIAVVGKVLGAYVGGLLARLPYWEALSLGFGLNARGVIEVIVATVGVKVGVLNTASYTIVILVAIATSLMTPPLLRYAISKVEQTAEEDLRRERLELHPASP